MLPFERAQPNLDTEDEVIVERILAIAIDTIILALLTGLLTEIGALVSMALGAVMGVLSVVLFFGYFIYFEAEYGQTPGKMVMNLVVVTEQGNPLTYRAATIRTLLRIVDKFPMFYLVGVVTIFLTDRSQRIGDLVAGTIVVSGHETGDKL